MRSRVRRIIIILAAAAAMAGLGGCARVAVEGGDKPIHIVMDINVRVDQKLDQFFAFEETTPVTAPTTRPQVGNADEAGGAQ
jgi:hypothetical protein